MSGLLGDATYDKSGLMPANFRTRTYRKGNGEKTNLTIKTNYVGSTFNAILTLHGVEGESCAIFISANRWNQTKLCCKVICGSIFSNTKLSYAIDSNNYVNVYIESDAYLLIQLQSFSDYLQAVFSKTEEVPGTSITLF